MFSSFRLLASRLSFSVSGLLLSAPVLARPLNPFAGEVTALDPASASQPMPVSAYDTVSLRDRLLAAAIAGRGETQLRAETIGRPTDAQSTFGYQVAEENPVCNGEFCVHYVASTKDAPALEDADHDGVPDSVQAVLAVLDEARTLLLSRGHSYHGINDGSRGGDPRMDVYLAAVDGFHGLAVPEQIVSESPTRMSSFMLVNVGLTTVPLSLLSRGVIAHELKHTFDVATFASAPAWLFESAATWFENEMNDESSSYADFFPCWFLFPELSLDSTRSDAYPPDARDTQSCVFKNTHLYGSAAFWFYATGRWGAELQGDLWTAAGEDCGDLPLFEDSVKLRSCVAEVLDDLFVDRGTTLADVYADFAAAMYQPRQSSVLLDVESDAELEAWPERAYARNLVTLPASGSTVVKHLASRYFTLSAAPDQSGRLDLGLTVTGSQPVRVQLLRSDGSGDASWEDVSLAPDGTATHSIAGFGLHTTQVTFVLTNVGTAVEDGAADSAAVAYSVTLDEDDKSDAIPKAADAPGASPAAQGCTVAFRSATDGSGGFLLLLGTAFLLLRRVRTRRRRWSELVLLALETPTSERATTRLRPSSIARDRGWLAASQRP